MTEQFFVFGSHFENDNEFKHHYYLINEEVWLPHLPIHSSDSCMSLRVCEVS